MKVKIPKSNHAALAAHIQALCTPSGDDFELDLGQLPDTTALLNAKKHEVDQHKLTKQALKDLQAEKATVDAELVTYQDLAKSNVPKANMDALEASYKKKLSDEQAARVAETAGLKKSLNKALVDKEAETIAGAISTAPKLLTPHIMSRLTVETDAEGNHVTRVLDAAGKPSALTLADLQKELVASKDFAPIIKATAAKGSSALKAPAGAGGTGGESDGKPFNFATANTSDIKARLEATGAVVTTEKE